MAANRTALHSNAVDAGARMVDFHGWELPLQFSGILEEHRAVRTAAGLFDVSHMGKVVIGGTGAAAFLDHLSPNTMAREVGRARYTHLLRDDGTILDDIIVTCLGPGEYFMVCNGAPREDVLRWMTSHAQGPRIRDLTMDHFCLALQGPRARAILQGLTGQSLGDVKSFSTALVPLALPPGGGVPVEMEGWGSASKRFLEALGRTIDGDQGPSVMVSRTGYTGEDGFELIGPNAMAPVIWDALLRTGATEGLKPCGLGARDTLRLEMGYPLSGQDFDGRQTTLELGYDWVIKWDHEFIGRAALEAQRRRGDYQHWRGLLLQEKGIPRTGQEVLQGGRVVGRVTSGTLSPTLSQGIAMAYLEPGVALEGAPVEVAIRGKRTRAKVVKPPFVRSPGAKG